MAIILGTVANKWAVLQTPGVQPMCSIDDAVEAESIILNDPVIIKLVKERYGVTDVKTQLVADPWYYGARTGGPTHRLEIPLSCHGCPCPYCRTSVWHEPFKVRQISGGS